MNTTQRRKAREALARRRGVSTDQITDAMVQQAIASSVITASDYGSASSSYTDTSSSYSSSDSSSGCY